MIYFLRIRDHVKIGHATNVLSRVHTHVMRFGPMSLIGAKPGDIHDERGLHFRFARFRVDAPMCLNGFKLREREWYSASDEILAFVATLPPALDVILEETTRRITDAVLRHTSVTEYLPEPPLHPSYEPDSAAEEIGDSDVQ